MKFREMPYKRPDPDAVITEIRNLTERLRRAQSYGEARAVFLEYEEKDKAVSTTAALAYIRQSIDTRDEFYGEEKARIAIVLLNQSNEADKAILDLVFEELFDNDGIAEFDYSEIVELLPKVIMFGRQQDFIQYISQSSFLDPEEKGDIIVQYNEQEEDQAEYDGRNPILADDTWF